MGSIAELEPGLEVRINYHGSWWPGQVITTTQQGLVRVTYDGYDANWDEEVPLDRVRYRQ